MQNELGLPQWWPDHPPIYDIQKTWKQNLEQGPQFTAPLPHRTLPPKKDWASFLGHEVASILGIPAGPLLDSRWTTLAGQLGYDIVTYKTIRSHSHPAHPLPNIVYVDCPDFLPQQHEAKTLRSRSQVPEKMGDVAITNSFGNPSLDPSFLIEDLARAKEALGPGQVLVASVFGSAASGKDPIQDYVDTARLAVEADIDVVEANFSCPNVSKGEGALYLDPEVSYILARLLVESIRDRPLIVKVGAYPSMAALRETLLSLAKAGVRAISGINTVSASIVNEDGKPALDELRPTGGICGRPIRQVALDFVRCAHQVIKTEKLDLKIIGVGGVHTPEHIHELERAGADFVQTATGMMWDPYLAARYHHSKTTLVSA